MRLIMRRKSTAGPRHASACSLPRLFLGVGFCLAGLLPALADTAAITGAAKSQHWAFRPPVRPPLPAVNNPKWVRTPIDHFILARLEKEGLAPSAKADRITLLRRLSLDLTGLPPTITEVDVFLADKSSDADGTQVERLLC